MDEALRAAERATWTAPEDPAALRSLARELARAGDEVGAWKARAHLAVTDDEAWAELAGRRTVGVRAVGEVVRTALPNGRWRRAVGASDDLFVFDGQEVLGADLLPRWTAPRVSSVLAGPRLFGVESGPTIPGVEARDLVVVRTRDGEVLRRGLLESIGHGSYFGGYQTAKWVVFLTRGALLIVDATRDDLPLLARHAVDQRAQTLRLSGRFLLRPTDRSSSPNLRGWEVRDLVDGALRRTIEGRVLDTEVQVALTYPAGRGGPRLALEALETGEERLSIRGPRAGLLGRERIVAEWNDELVGLDRATGRRCWRQPRGDLVKLAAAADVLYALRRSDAGGRVEAFDLAGGAPLWAQDVPGDASNMRFFPADGALYVQVSEDGQLFLTRIAAS